MRPILFMGFLAARAAFGMPTETDAISGDDMAIKMQKGYKEMRAANERSAPSMTFFNVPREQIDDSPMAEISNGQLVTISGFKFCSMYDSSLFRGDAPFYTVISNNERDHINAQATTISEYGEEKFIGFIDQVARQVFEDILEARGDDAAKTDPESLKRLACHYAIDGKNSYLHFASVKLLQYVNPDAYFPDIAFSSPPSRPILNAATKNDPPTPDFRNGKLPHFKLAFTILCHENVVALEYLIETLLAKGEENVIIAVQIDKKAAKFADEVEKLILRKRWNTVFKTRDTHIAAWGGVGLVYGQLSAYFELLDRCTFDYVINMSAYDAVLMDTDVMYDYIKKHSDGRSIFSELDTAGETEVSTRLNRLATLHTTDGHKPNGLEPHGFKKGETPNLNPNAYNMRVASPDNYPYETTHQWNVLTYEFVNKLRHDPVAPTILIPMEWSYLAHEIYFSAYARWRSVPTKNFHTRCYDYNSSHRTHSLTLKSKWFIEKCVKAGRIIARKYDVTTDKELAPFLVEMRKESRRLASEDKFELLPHFLVNEYERNNGPWGKGGSYSDGVGRAKRKASGTPKYPSATPKNRERKRDWLKRKWKSFWEKVAKFFGRNKS